MALDLTTANLSTSTLALLKLGIGLLPHDKVNDYLQGRCLVPIKVHKKLIAHLDPTQQRKADDLRQQLAETQANYLVHLVSMGGIEPDYTEFEGVLELDDAEESDPVEVPSKSKDAKSKKPADA